MADQVAIAVLGCSGRMGQMLIQAIDEREDCKLSGVTERPGHDWVGNDLGVAMGGAARDVFVEDDPLEVFARSQAVLDFTSPAATVTHANLAAQARLAHVIGTTGFEQQHLTSLSAAARHGVLIRAGNMSLGVNLLTLLMMKVLGLLVVLYP